MKFNFNTLHTTAITSNAKYGQKNPTIQNAQKTWTMSAQITPGRSAISTAANGAWCWTCAAREKKTGILTVDERNVQRKIYDLLSLQASLALEQWITITEQMADLWVFNIFLCVLIYIERRLKLLFLQNL